MSGKPLDPAADFRDDGGTPAFRARQAAARHQAITRPVWAVIRFIWLFPLIGTAAAFIFAAFWMLGIMLAGDAQFWGNGWWIAAALFALSIAWERIAIKEGGLGSGALDFRRMMNSPSGGAWGAIATYFRSLFVLLYAAYSIFFWWLALVIGITLWPHIIPFIRATLSG